MSRVIKTPPATPVPLSPEARRQALLQGLGGVLGAFALILVASFVVELVDPTSAHLHEWWRRGLFGTIGLLGELVAVLGMWRLSVARDQRWDLPGVFAAVVLCASVPLCLLWMFLTLLSFSPGPIFGG